MQMYVNFFDRHVKSDAVVELTLSKDANIYASQYQL